MQSDSCLPSFLLDGFYTSPLQPSTSPVSPLNTSADPAPPNYTAPLLLSANSLEWDYHDYTHSCPWPTMGSNLQLCACGHLSINHNHLGCMVSGSGSFQFCTCSESNYGPVYRFNLIKLGMEEKEADITSSMFQTCVCGHFKVEHVSPTSACTFCIHSELDPCLCVGFNQDPSCVQSDLDSAKEVECTWRNLQAVWKCR